MDSAFGYYVLQSYDEGARITTIFSKQRDMAPLNDTNTSIFQAYVNLAQRNKSDVKLLTTSSSLICISQMTAMMEPPVDPRRQALASGAQ